MYLFDRQITGISQVHGLLFEFEQTTKWRAQNAVRFRFESNSQDYIDNLDLDIYGSDKCEETAHRHRKRILAICNSASSNVSLCYVCIRSSTVHAIVFTRYLRNTQRVSQLSLFARLFRAFSSVGNINSRELTNRLGLSYDTEGAHFARAQHPLQNRKTVCRTCIEHWRNRVALDTGLLRRTIFY